MRRQTGMVCVGILLATGCDNPEHSLLQQKETDILSDIQLINGISQYQSEFAGESSPKHNQVARRIDTRFSNRDTDSILSRDISYLNNQIVGYISNTIINNTIDVSIRFEQPGTDGTWFTRDDGILLYTDFNPSIGGIDSITYDNPGQDAIWQTSDDRVRYYSLTINEIDGSKTTVFYSIAGSDGQWLTADDEIGWTVYEGPITNGEQHWAIYVGPGPDNDWNSVNDNVVYQHALRQFNANSQFVRHIAYTDIGPDNLAFTADDGILYYHDYTYDSLGRLSQSIHYWGGPGADGIWFSGDDLINSCKIQQRDANDLTMNTITYRPGVDGNCFTADDMVWGYHVDTHINGQLTNSTAYYGAGADGQWFTIDDIIVNIREYQPLL